VKRSPPSFWGIYECVAGTIDRKVGWDKVPVLGGLLVLVGVRRTLRRENLHDTRTVPVQDPPAVPEYEERFRTERTPDGTYNDLEDPSMGMAGARFGRNVPLDRTHPEPLPDMLEPNPRTVSLELMTRDPWAPATSVNNLAACWLQFMIRDWFSHGKSEPDNPWQIELTDDDPFPEHPMQVMRTRRDPTRAHAPSDRSDAPTYVNTSTHWWDGSSIYGTSLEQQARARSGEDGKLRIGIDGRLPVDPDPERDPTREPGFWVGLLMLHTLFTLEHNAICDRLRAEYPTWDDEQLFQRARLINAALLAKIHTMEWTPAVISHPTTVTALRANWFGLAEERVHKLFGRICTSEVISGIPGSETAHYGVPFALTEEFVAVYRMHPLIADHWSMRAVDDDRPLDELTFRELTGPASLALAEELGMANLFYSFGTEHPGVVQLHNFPKFLQEFERPDGKLMDRQPALGRRDPPRLRRRHRARRPHGRHVRRAAAQGLRVLRHRVSDLRPDGLATPEQRPLLHRVLRSTGLHAGRHRLDRRQPDERRPAAPLPAVTRGDRPGQERLRALAARRHLSHHGVGLQVNEAAPTAA